MKAKSKYYTDVFVILDQSKKKKLQDEFILSLENDMVNWSKISKYRDFVYRLVKGNWTKIYLDDPNYKSTSGDECMRETKIKYYSPNYNEYIFCYDLSKNICMILNTKYNCHELVFDYTDYFWNKYPNKLRKLLKRLVETVFTTESNNLTNAIPKTPIKNRFNENIKKREERGKKLNQIFNGTEDSTDSA